MVLVTMVGRTPWTALPLSSGAMQSDECTVGVEEVESIIAEILG